ncbi:MAG: DUF2272 domain-containing protein [Methylococcaceae bacterium]|jgi:Uncharacterized protein conserved in bacteria (DUF2272)
MRHLRYSFIVLALFMLPQLQGCAGKKKPTEVSTGALEPEDSNASKKKGRHTRSQAIVQGAESEWNLFGRQTIELDSTGESIPHVGHWEDDGDPWSSRVNVYWSSVGKHSLDGYDCKQPWSAAFISYVMGAAGLSREEFPRSDAHWNYIQYFTRGNPSAAFLTHKITEYSPKEGDLICATRGSHGFIPVYDHLNTSTVLMGHAKLHCDIVVEKKQDVLLTIGGNVRNSVSKTKITLGKNGFLKPTEQRPWFVVLENKLD